MDPGGWEEGIPMDALDSFSHQDFLQDNFLALYYDISDFDAAGFI
jgi:hypothetical protein